MRDPIELSKELILYDAPLKIVEGSALTGEQKKDLLNRLARVEGQLRGVQKLIAQAAVLGDCAGIAQQLSAARKALDRSFITLLTSAMVTNTAGAASADDALARARAATELLTKFG